MHQTCDATLCGSGSGAWPPGTILKLTFIVVHSEGCFNLVPVILRGNKCITTKVAACKHVYSKK